MPCTPWALRKSGKKARIWSFLAHPDGRTTLLPLHPEIRVKLLTKIIKKDLRMGKDAFLRMLP